jgi:hypothetical protein
MATVLIVEDQAQILALVQSLLEEEGHKIFTAPAVALKPGLKVVYSTGLTLTDHVKALLVPGAVVLEKPYKLDQLLTSLLDPHV